MCVMIHLGTQMIETNRLKLRRFELSDAAAMFKNWAGDPEVTKYLMWPAHADVGVTRSILEEWTGKYEDDSFYLWAITLKSQGDEPIGSISVVSMDERLKMVHFGYCIGRKWWNQGITSEAFSTLIHFFFTEVKANRVESRHDPRNPSSGRVMEKCGLVYEGTVKEGDWNNQGLCDYAIYGLVAADYDSKGG